MTIAVDAVVYFRIQNPVSSVINVEDATRSTKLLAQTTLRNVLGTRSLSEILMERETISQSIQVILVCLLVCLFVCLIVCLFVCRLFMCISTLIYTYVSTIKSVNKHCMLFFISLYMYLSIYIHRLPS